MNLIIQVWLVNLTNCLKMCSFHPEPFHFLANLPKFFFRAFTRGNIFHVHVQLSWDELLLPLADFQRRIPLGPSSWLHFSKKPWEVGQAVTTGEESSWTMPVCPSGPSMDGRARLDGRLWKIARLKPVFLWFCPSICDFGHVQRVSTIENLPGNFFWHLGEALSASIFPYI